MQKSAATPLKELLTRILENQLFHKLFHELYRYVKIQGTSTPGGHIQKLSEARSRLDRRLR
jgi:hypothetical protein